MNELIEYTLDTENANKNFNLALWYYNQEHFAPALSFFLRAAERSEDDLLAYESLLLGFYCYDKQSGRNATSQVLLEHAICLLPRRPEAHFLLCKLYEKKGECHHLSYKTAHLALLNCDFDLDPLSINTDYPGKYGFIFQKAHMGYYWGKSKECRLLFRELIDDYNDEMDDTYKKIVQSNLTSMGSGPVDVAFNQYDPENVDKLRFKFTDCEKITKNFSQVYQDMFVLSLYDGKRNGTYLEIGGGDPFLGNNSALLEKNYDWKGISIEYNRELTESYNKVRKNKALCKNALEIDYKKLLDENFDTNVIDYLQLDCEPSKSTFEILLGIPFDTYKFGVITYEHDHFVDITKTYRQKSRNYLKSIGYELIVNDIGPTDWYSFEDWWVNPELIDSNIIEKMKNIISGINHAEKYMIID